MVFFIVEKMSCQLLSRSLLASSQLLLQPPAITPHLKLLLQPPATQLLAPSCAYLLFSTTTTVPSCRNSLLNCPAALHSLVLVPSSSALHTSAIVERARQSTRIRKRKVAVENKKKKEERLRKNPPPLPKKIQLMLIAKGLGRFLSYFYLIFYCLWPLRPKKPENWKLRSKSCAYSISFHKLFWLGSCFSHSSRSEIKQ
jgi:hypothetical protein